MVLELRFNISVNTVTQNMGTGVPPWDGNFAKANWWTSSNRDTDYWYSTNGNTTYIQYGQNHPIWASTRFWAETVEILEETQHDDNSVTARVRVTPHYWRSGRTDYGSVGYRVNYRILVNDTQIWTYSGRTTDTIAFSQGQVQELEITLPPGGTSSKPAFQILTNYPDGQYPNYNMFIGYHLYNPLDDIPDEPPPPPPPPPPQTYIPFALRQSGSWNALNDHEGFIHIRQGGWVDKSEEMLDTSRQPNQGHNQVRKGGQWLQAPPMSGSSAV